MRKRNRTVIKADRIEHVDVARVHNPRYLVSRDGEEVGIFPGYNALMAINAARKIYGPGKYSSTKTGEAMYLGRGALETERREREERTARAATKAAAKRDKIQLPKKSRTRRNAEGWRNEYEGAFNSIIFGTRHKKVIDLGRRKRGAERDLVMSYADDLLQLTMKNVAALDDAAILAELSSKARASAKRKHKVDPTRAALLLDQAEEIMLGGRRNPRRGSQSWAGSTANPQSVPVDFRQQLDANKNQVAKLRQLIIENQLLEARPTDSQRDISALREIGEINANGYIQNLPHIYRYSDLFKYRHGSVSDFLNQEIARWTRENAQKKRNPAEKDAEHPIEVTRHFRGGPPGYLSPWQKAMAIGQQELFDTGIKLAPRAAELRAARLSNPGATKPVYQSGLKQATAGQLPRLARVGLRVGKTPAEIRSDLATTGRFTAEQIRRAIDQATTAERRSNPTKQRRRNSREYDGPSYPFLKIAMVDPNKPWGGADWFRLNEADRIKRNILSMQRSGIYPPGPQRFEIYDTREGAFRETGEYITIDPLTYRAISDPDYDEWIKSVVPNPRKRETRNPPVRQIFETFNGRPATKTTIVQAPRRTPARVAQLGRLRLIRTADGRTWRFPGERAPFLAADSRGKLHVVGGQYRANPAGEECGEIEQIEYQTSKPHLGHDNETIYYHQLGEETGERPILGITPAGELQITGGNYRIEADGIHN